MSSENFGLSPDELKQQKLLSAFTLAVATVAIQSDVAIETVLQHFQSRKASLQGAYTPRVIAVMLQNGIDAVDAENYVQQTKSPLHTQGTIAQAFYIQYLRDARSARGWSEGFKIPDWAKGDKAEVSYVKNAANSVGCLTGIKNLAYQLLPEELVETTLSAVGVEDEVKAFWTYLSQLKSSLAA